MTPAISRAISMPPVPPNIPPIQTISSVISVKSMTVFTVSMKILFEDKFSLKG